MMNNTFEEETITALKSLFAKVDTLRRINIRDLLKPDVYRLYKQTLQEAYDALTKVEDALTAVGMKLEYQHWRLGGAVEELKPLLIDTRATSDQVMDAFEERLS
jgi:spore cortex formation protein SpoVR/YcgB (stage V sporulation)